MDLIIQVNPPTFLCCSSHTWAFEDDERWVGRKGKEGRCEVAQATRSSPVPRKSFSSLSFQKQSCTVQLHPAQECLLPWSSSQYGHSSCLPGHVHLVLFTVRAVSKNSEAQRRNTMGCNGEGVGNRNLKISHLLLILDGMYNTISPRVSRTVSLYSRSLHALEI